MFVLNKSIKNLRKNQCDITLHNMTIIYIDKSNLKMLRIEK